MTHDADVGHHSPHCTNTIAVRSQDPILSTYTFYLHFIQYLFLTLILHIPKYTPSANIPVHKKTTAYAHPRKKTVNNKAHHSIVSLQGLFSCVTYILTHVPLTFSLKNILIFLIALARNPEITRQFQAWIITSPGCRRRGDGCYLTTCLLILSFL